MNTSLSFISDFDLENENENDDTFNSSFDDNSVEEITIERNERKRYKF